MNERLSPPARDSEEFAAQIYGVGQARASFRQHAVDGSEQTNAHKQQRGSGRWQESLDGAPL